MKNKITIGYVSSESAASILLIGDQATYADLSSYFNELATMSVGESRKLNHDSLFVVYGMELSIIVTAEAKGMRKVGDHAYEWGLSQEKIMEFADFFVSFSAPLRSDKTGSHVYLDCSDLDDIEVKASLYEYPENFFEEIYSRGE